MGTDTSEEAIQKQSLEIELAKKEKLLEELFPLVENFRYSETCDCDNCTFAVKEGVRILDKYLQESEETQSVGLLETIRNIFQHVEALEESSERKIAADRLTDTEIASFVNMAKAVLKFPTWMIVKLIQKLSKMAPEEAEKLLSSK